MHAEYLNISENVQCHSGKASFITLFTLSTLCSYATPLFNITKFPEKYYPGSKSYLEKSYQYNTAYYNTILSSGTFDIVGHSHQWFHITIALAFYFQSHLVESAVMEVEQQEEHR